jgi:hypothetical protein
MRLLLSLAALLVSIFAGAQKTDFFTRDSNVSNVIIHKDPRLDVLSSKQAEINKRANYYSTTIRSGYRLQVINTQNRDEANNVKAEMLRRFPEEKAYLLYQSPTFKVRVGNFITQKDAQPLRKLISNLYPDRGIYIVQDMIEYSPKNEEEIPGEN